MRINRIVCLAATMFLVGALLYGCLGTSGGGGTGSTINNYINLGRAATMFGGGNNSFIIDDAGFGWRCGLNDYGQIGDGTTTSQSFMSRVFGGLRMTSMAGGRHHSLALVDDNTVWAWGRNGDGELGNGATFQQVTPIRVTGF